MNAEQKSFIEVVGAIASADMKNSGVAASLTTAQAILESAWGKSELTKTGNALFGIKATKDWNKISIKNIGIIHNREFEQGVLKIEFYEEDAMERAIALLKKRNYIVYER